MKVNGDNAERIIILCYAECMMTENDDKAIGRRLRQARLAMGYEEVGDAADALGMKYSTYAGHENGNRGLLRSIQKYADFYNVTLEWLMTGKGKGPGLLNPPTTIFDHEHEVPMDSYVGAGEIVYPIEDGGHYVEAPPGATPETKAAGIRGDSMLPAFEDGWIIYWSKHLPPEEMINRRCVVQVSDGRRYVKTLRRGSTHGLWTLTSSNASDIEDVDLEWAAPIDWIKPRGI